MNTKKCFLSPGDSLPSSLLSSSSSSSSKIKRTFFFSILSNSPYISKHVLQFDCSHPQIAVRHSYFLSFILFSNTISFILFIFLLRILPQCSLHSTARIYVCYTLYMFWILFHCVAFAFSLVVLIFPF